MRNREGEGGDGDWQMDLCVGDQEVCPVDSVVGRESKALY